MKIATASANANIALIKYWGKRDEFFMLPTKSSLSVGLDALRTTTQVEFSNTDSILINGIMADDETKIKILRFLYFFRKKFELECCFSINTTNNFPTAAGLASSASGIAALAKCLNELCALNLDSKSLSVLARRGSGSASRSILGGFNLWHKGLSGDGSDSYAEQIFNASHWPEFRIIVAIVQTEKKHISSTEAMQITTKTCKTYNNWLTNSGRRINSMIKAIENRDLEAVGELAQVDCLEMHETMRNSSPSINYWTNKTIKIIELVNSLRNNGTQCYFTIDAGPNVKILTLAKYQAKIVGELNSLPEIQQVIASGVACD